MYKPNKLEYNSIPSQLNTSAGNDGVPSQLVTQAQDPPKFDGVTIEQMRDNPLYSQLDDIDKVGLAQQRLVENAKTIRSKSKYIRALNDAASKPAKPK